MKKGRRCGACNRKFKSAKELADHLKECQIAKIGRGALEAAIGSSKNQEPTDE